MTWRQYLWLVNWLVDVADRGDVCLALTSPRHSSRDGAGGRIHILCVEDGGIMVTLGVVECICGVEDVACSKEW